MRLTTTEAVKRGLLNSPYIYRRNQDLEKYFSMQIFSEWEHGGMCPWQAYRRIKFKGIRYTLYIRERHDYTSAEILYGWTGFKKYDAFTGVLTVLNLEEDMDVAHPDKIMEGYVIGWCFSSEPHRSLFDRVEEKARRFFEENKYNQNIPKKIMDW